VVNDEGAVVPHAMVGFATQKDAVTAFVKDYSNAVREATKVAPDDFVDWVNEGSSGEAMSFGKKFKPIVLRKQRRGVDSGGKKGASNERISQTGAVGNQASQGERGDERLRREAVMGGGAGNFEAAASFIRGVHSADAEASRTEPKTRDERAKRNSRLKLIEESTIRAWAKANGFWKDGSEFLAKHTALYPDPDDGQGAEHMVLPPPNGGEGRWLKANSGWLHGTWKDYFERVGLHNAYFPETAYRFEGFADIDGKLHVLVN
jgi:hypothetical protein